MAPSWPQRRPRWPQRRPTWVPKGPKRGPKSLPNKSSKACPHRSRETETPHQSETSILDIFGALLEPLLGPCWVPWELIKPLKTTEIRNIKCPKTIVKYRSDGPSGSPREGHVGVMLGSSWHLKGILRHMNIILPTKLNLRGARPIFRGSAGTRGPPGEGI